nr:MAG TPA: hypothetical protein [Siphoviridae sp. ctQHO9]
MTNKEKYGNEIIELATRTALFGLKNGEPALCKEIKCEDCNFYKSDYSCEGSAYGFRKWLNSEYVEPPVDWSKVPVDTPILVRNSEEETWRKRYFAKYENETVYAWDGGKTSWSVGSKLRICDWKFAKLAESEE